MSTFRDFMLGLAGIAIVIALVLFGLGYLPVQQSAPQAPVVTAQPPAALYVNPQGGCLPPPEGYMQDRNCAIYPIPGFGVTPSGAASPMPAAQQAAPVSSCQPGTTDLSTIKWGPAGYAPQTAEEAAQVLGVSQNDALYLTVLNPCAGDPRVIGWVLGTTSSQNAGIRVMASHVPQGTVIDYDPGVTQISGSIANTVAFTTKWSRSDATSTLSVSTLKVTVYWTVRDDRGFISGIPQALPSTTLSCPIVSGIQTNSMPDGGCKLIADHAVTFVVPTGMKVLYDDGASPNGVWAQAGATVSTYTASFYPQ